MKVTQMKPFGVKVTDFDINNPDDLSQLPSLLYSNGIILMPKDAAAKGAPSPNLPENLTKMGVLFGTPLMKHDIDKFVEEGKPVVALETGGDSGIVPDSYYFHSDVSWWKDPCAVALLTCVVKPPSGGGITSFQNANAMYNRLSPESREFMETHRFLHSLHHAYAIAGRDEIKNQAEVSQMHPGVIRHPKFGQPLAYISKSSSVAIEGMTREESAPIIDKLLGEMYSEEGTYAHDWTEGDIVFWDNFGVQHKANNDYIERRVMHKVTLMGNHPPPTKYEVGVNGEANKVAPIQDATSILT